MILLASHDDAETAEAFAAADLEAELETMLPLEERTFQPQPGADDERA